MIIKNLARNCRKQLAVKMFDDSRNGIQWLGDRGGIYPAYGIPRMDKNQVLFVFDVPEEKRDKCLVAEYDDISDYFDISDGASDNEAVGFGLPMFFGGKLIYPVSTSGGVAFYEASAFEPIRDCKDAKLYERYTEAGDLYFVAKDGMMVEAVISPVPVDKKELLKRMAAITAQLKADAETEEEEKA